MTPISRSRDRNGRSTNRFRVESIEFLMMYGLIFNPRTCNMIGGISFFLLFSTAAAWSPLSGIRKFVARGKVSELPASTQFSSSTSLIAEGTPMCKPKIANSIVDLIGGTPMLRLGKIAEGCGADILLKLESMEPCNSVKDRIGRSMIVEAEVTYNSTLFQ